MSDHILESLFLDQTLWSDVLEWGVRKGIAQPVLTYIQDPNGRAKLCEQIYTGEYPIEPPHTGYVKKEDGGERTFFINAPLTRLLFHAIYLWLMRHEGSMIHPACLSYHEGIGIGKIVQNVSRQITTLHPQGEPCVVGRKFDIHHYFDTIPRSVIHNALDKVERHHGPSSVITLIRKYYDSDLYYDTRKGDYMEAYQGIKQGCAVSSWFANVLLYELDAKLSALGGCYVRYSDDILFVGESYEKATTLLKEELQKIGLSLNEEKQEDIRSDRFVRFLGFDIRGGEITLSEKWVKHFQRQVDEITILNKPLIQQVRRLRKQATEASEKHIQTLAGHAMQRLAKTLYWGNGTYSWGTLVLPIINRADDIRQLNTYCLDALRALYTGRTHLGGLGKPKQGGITRGKGRDVAYNRKATGKWLSQFTPLSAMWQLVGNKWLYRTLVNDLLLAEYPKYPITARQEGVSEEVLNRRYAQHLKSEPDGKKLARFYAKPLEEQEYEDLLFAPSRATTTETLDATLRSFGSFNELAGNHEHWFWQSTEHPELVVLRKWWELEDD